MLNPPVTSLWINVAWLSLHCVGPRRDAWEAAWDEANARALAKPALVDWLGRSFDVDREASYLEIGDRATPQLRLTRRRREVAYRVPVARLEQADDLDAVLDAIIREIFAFWAEQKGITPPPL